MTDFNAALLAELAEAKAELDQLAPLYAAAQSRYNAALAMAVARGLRAAPETSTSPSFRDGSKTSKILAYLKLHPNGRQFMDISRATAAGSTSAAVSSILCNFRERGLVENPERGFWKLTETGMNA